MLLRQTWLRFVLRFAIAGLFVAMGLSIAALFGAQIQPPLEKLVVVLWPSSLMLMGLGEGGGGYPLSFWFWILIAIASNGVFYGFVGLLVSFFYRYLNQVLR